MAASSSFFPTTSLKRFPMVILDRLRALYTANAQYHSLPTEEIEVRVATTVVLLTVAEVDMELHPKEVETMMTMLAKTYHLNEEEMGTLMALAAESRGHVPDLWPFTNTIRRVLTEEQKLHLLEMVWRVAFADGKLDPHEDNLAHRLQHMIAVNHSLLMEAKKRARIELP